MASTWIILGLYVVIKIKVGYIIGQMTLNMLNIIQGKIKIR